MEQEYIVFCGQMYRLLVAVLAIIYVEWTVVKKNLNYLYFIIIIIIINSYILVFFKWKISYIYSCFNRPLFNKYMFDPKIVTVNLFLFYFNEHKDSLY